MASEDKKDVGNGKPQMSQRRFAALLIYIFVLTILAKLYWPTREAPVSTAPAVTNPASGQVPNN